MNLELNVHINYLICLKIIATFLFYTLIKKRGHERSGEKKRKVIFMWRKKEISVKLKSIAIILKIHSEKLKSVMR